jgi:hypothetical protein
MFQTISDAMISLGESGLIFGSENPQKGESEFQLALSRKLTQLTAPDGWVWRHSGSSCIRLYGVISAVRSKRVQDYRFPWMAPWKGIRGSPIRSISPKASSVSAA